MDLPKVAAVTAVGTVRANMLGSTPFWCVPRRAASSRGFA
jgi:hypothetical protein